MPFDSARNEDLGVAAGAGPFAKLLSDAPATDAVLCRLMDARAIIARGWCQGPWAVDAEGHPVDEGSADAVAFCTAGVFNCLWARDPNYAVHSIARRLVIDAVPADFKPSQTVGRHIRYSDHPSTSHADVLALFDRAIAARRAELAL